MTQLKPHQGDTIYYSVVVEDAEAITGTGTLSYTQNGTTIEKSGTLAAGTFSCVFTHEETKVMSGKYLIQLKLKNSANDDIGTAFRGSLIIEESAMPDFGE